MCVSLAMLITLVCEDIRHKVMLDYTIIIITVAIARLHMKLPGSGHVGVKNKSSSLLWDLNSVFIKNYE